MDASMTIAGVAKEGAVGVETVRYYQRRGLLDTPRRPPGGVRRYGASHVRRLRFIRRAQEIGFSLADIAQLLRLERTPDCGQARRLASGKLAEVEAKLADLERMRESLQTMIEACASGRDPRTCPIVDTLVRATASVERTRAV